MKRIATSFLCMLSLLFALQLQAAGPQDASQRKQWFNNMVQTKIDYLAKQMELTPDQKARFEKQYAAMSAETARLAGDTRNMQKNVAKKDNPNDLELEKAAEAIAEFKSKEGAIEMKYFNQFKTYLTKKQLFKLKTAESKWMKMLMNHRGKGKK
ncbi:MAG: hypothetical protein NC338_05825 [Firmicutes bacterium]|nr:hypothetical protein [Bacillota bacterium]MCM1400492.1 hypothetical protein [Bacteroides sp.]MCM1476880.1 hypothetical protein [Bacteroides sp.]